MPATKDSGFPVATFSTANGTVDLAWTGFTTPGTNRLVVAVLLGNGAAAKPIDSFTSPNLTWANSLAVVDAAGENRVEIWTAWAPSVVTTEVITMSHDTVGISYGRRSCLVFSIGGSESAGVGNTASNNAGANGTPQLAITATAAGSYLLAGFHYRSDGADIGIDASTTHEYAENAGGGFAFNERAGSRASSGAGSHTLLWTGTPLNWATIGGIEIKATVAVSDLNAHIGEPITGSSVLN